MGMDSRGRSILSFDTQAGHTELVFSVMQGGSTESVIDEVSDSWLRSAGAHGVDPVNSAAPRILTANEVKVLRGPLDKLIFSARSEIDRLYSLVRPAGYALLFCDLTGSVVEHRGEDTEASQFAYWGTWLGGVWSESVEGTNGIGTCIAEERPVTIHRGQHFRSRHKDLSCSGAPVFGIDGRMIAVLDVSAIDPNLSERAHGLTGTLTTSAARAIEEQYFREHFHREWIIATGQPDEESASAILLAADANQRVVGANRAARKSFTLDDGGLHAGISLWRLFERDPEVFRHGYGTDMAATLMLTGSDEAWPAIITPPLSGSGAGQNLAKAMHHVHPRIEMLRNLRNLAPYARARGGLSPGAVRRVREYVEAHMSENIDLAALAAVAGLSVYHFAREFKRSTGVTPHDYLVGKRIERAQDMLARTAYSLTEIAIAAGFSDQSHLARHFRQIVGSTPREFRWSMR
jgi:AraC-like DNA-binding protein